MTGARADMLEAPAIDLHKLPSLEQILPQLVDKRVVFVGENHDQYSHHLVQLAIIRALHREHGDIALGVEFFQQPFQAHLDAFVAGEIDEATMLRRTEYMERWSYDYRLYQPILQYAREHRIPLVALNMPKELTARVAEHGIAALSEEERTQLPEIDRGSAPYRERLRALYEAHPVRKGGSFENFLEVQLLWDEGMAARAAGYLQEHPGRRMVVLAGAGHLAYRDGIPRRLERRMPLSSAVVLSGAQETLSPAVADFVLLPAPVALPPKGMMGVLMETADKGVRVTRFTETSAAQEAGVKQNDCIVGIDEASVDDTTDVQLALLSRKPGEVVRVGVLREAGTAQEELLQYQVQLR
ncbi:MAG: ChaN family lipoprotein [Thiohalomonadaceae bacterium]